MLAFAIAITRAWTATYTRGLPAVARDARVAEIHSDLWEHQRAAGFEREPVADTGVAILTRVVLGVPADLLWRIEAGSSTRTDRSTSVNDTLIMRAGLFALSLPLLFLILNGVGVMLGSGEFDSGLDQVIWGLAFLVCPLVSLVGLWLCASQPKLGLGLTIGGTLASALVMFWMAFITVPVGIVVIIFAIKRSGLSIWPFNGPRPSATGSA
jgi:hypothetical protein